MSCLQALWLSSLQLEHEVRGRSRKQIPASEPPLGKDRAIAGHPGCREVSQDFSQASDGSLARLTAGAEGAGQGLLELHPVIGCSLGFLVLQISVFYIYIFFSSGII